jgi:hypothetical protein
MRTELMMNMDTLSFKQIENNKAVIILEGYEKYESIVVDSEIAFAVQGLYKVFLANVEGHCYVLNAIETAINDILSADEDSL